MNERDIIWYTKMLEMNCDNIDEIVHKMFANSAPLAIEDRYVLREQLQMIQSHVRLLSKATKEPKEVSRFKKLFRRK